jgi:acyl dehydratase
MSAEVATKPAPQMTKADMKTALKKLIGPVNADVKTTIELGACRRMALALDNYDPIHFDHAAALRRGYKGIVAPWPLLWLFFFNCSEYHLDLPFGRATVHGQDDYRFHIPMIVGDEITTSTDVIEANLKEGRSGLLGHVVTRRRFTNQNGEVCAELITTLIRR